MSALMAERSHQAVSYVQGVSAQVPDGFDAGTSAEFLEPLGRQRRQRRSGQVQFAQQLELAQLLEQGFQADTARVAPQV